ncbi:M91 family zinc metallopeptidase [Aliikangiella maris]|uniref:M91 family zinc metallopeptidase n=2 Tax=Aliikangiella maris TaxID=3162458 RepID=A0ABV2BR35_9GAMM
MSKRISNTQFNNLIIQFIGPLLMSFCFITQSIAIENQLTGQSQTTDEIYKYTTNITVKVENFQQAVKVFQWLDLIRLTNIGEATLNSIENSQHQLIIFHSDVALLSAGITGATLSENLTNGVGEDAYIKFFLDMDENGTNCILNENGHYVPYLAVHNLFHELIHAKHKMNGTWLYFNSERQAIKEENIFRIEWAGFRFTSYSLRTEYFEDEDIKLSYNGSCHSS